MTASALKSPAQFEARSPTTRRRQFIGANETPSCAITWTTPYQKAQRLNRWRSAVSRGFPRSARMLVLAWNLEWLFKDGFAYVSDSYLSRKLGIPVNKIQDSLKALEDGGAIYRASVFVDGKAQRRIWPSKEIVRRMYPVTGGSDTPSDGMQTTPRHGGTEYSRNRSHSKLRMSSTAEAARKQAELAEKRARERSVNQ